MERTILMSIEEIKRTSVFSKLQAKALTQQEAADDLGITTRQVRRLFKVYKKHGAIALVSKKRGRPSNHQLLGGVKELVLAIIQEKYPDFGPTLAHEKIVEVHKIKISVWSVRRLMIVNTLWIDKKIKRKRIYQLRERRSK